MDLIFIQVRDAVLVLLLCEGNVFYSPACGGYCLSPVCTFGIIVKKLHKWRKRRANMEEGREKLMPKCLFNILRYLFNIYFGMGNRRGLD